MKHHHKAGRWLSILLTLAMVLAMLPTAALAAEGPSTPHDFTLYYREGKLYKSESGSDIFEGEGITWSGDGATLTLTNFQFTTSALTALMLPNDTTIVLVGVNSIAAQPSSPINDTCVGLEADGNLTICSAPEERGSLTVSAGDMGDYGYVYGMNTFGVMLTVDNADLTAVSGKCNNQTSGIYGTSLTLKNRATVRAETCETVLDEGQYNDHTGLYLGMGTGIFFDGGGNTLIARGWARALQLSNSFSFDGVSLTTKEVSLNQQTGEPKAENPSFESGTFKVDAGNYKEAARYVKLVSGDSAYTLFYDADNGKMYKNNVQGGEVTADTVPGWTGDGGNLTLNGFNFSTSANTALKVSGDTTIILTGENSITAQAAQGGTGEYIGIDAREGKLTIQGTTGSSLIVTGDAGESGQGSVGVVGGYSGVTVDGATLTAIGKGGTGGSIGLNAGNGGLTLKNQATVIGQANETGASAIGVYSFGENPLQVEGKGNTIIAQGAIALNIIGMSEDTFSTQQVSVNYDGTNPDTSFEYNRIGGTYTSGKGASRVNAKYVKLFDGTPTPTPTKGTITVGAQPANKTVTYGEISGALTAAGTASNGKAVSYQWYSATAADKTGAAAVPGATAASLSIPTDLNAGSYYYFCKLTAENCDSVDSNVATVTVNKAVYTGATSATTYVKANQTITLSYSLPSLPDGASYPNVSSNITTSGGFVGNQASVAAGKLYCTVNSPAEGASATITVPVTGAVNYQDYSFTLTVTATNRTVSSIYSLSADTSLIYSGQAQKGYTGTPTFDPGVTVDPDSLVYRYAGSGNTTYGPSETAPTDAGTYKLTVSIPEEDTTYIGSVDLSFTIGKKPVKVSLENQSITAGQTVPSAYSLKYEGLVTGEGIAPVFPGGITFTYSGIPTSSTAGTYSIVWTNADAVTSWGERAKNYAITTLGTGTLTINPNSGNVPGGGEGGGGGGEGGGGSTVTVPVTGQDTVEVNADVSGSTATITDIDSSRLGAEDRTVTIDLTGLKKTINKVSLPKKSVDSLVKADAEGLELKLTTGIVAFDAKALSAINDAANGSTITLEVKETSTSSLSSSQKETIDDLDNAVVININMVSNGKVISDFKGGQATVTIPYELKPGQDPESVTVYFLSSDGKLTAMETTYDARTGTVTFIAPHFSSYVITSEAGGWVNPFVDVKDGDWFYEAVKLMNGKGLMAGTSATTFSPDGTTTRGMIVTILYRLEGGPSSPGEGSAFTDVPAGRYYSDAVAWASANGVVTGYSDGRFGPNDLITREQMAAILHRYARLKGCDTAASGDLSGFKDQPSAWAAEAMKWAVGKGIITGKDGGTLDPHGSASRAQVAVMLQRFLEA